MSQIRREWPTSQENIELAKAGTAALNDSYRTGDIQPWRRLVEAHFHPEAVLEGGGDAFTEGEWRGHEGAVGFVVNQMEVLEGMWVRAEEYIDAGDDCLIVGITFGGRARHTGIEVELSPFHVFNFRGGMIFRWRIYQSRAQALEAAGLSE